MSSEGFPEAPISIPTTTVPQFESESLVQGNQLLGSQLDSIYMEPGTEWPFNSFMPAQLTQPTTEASNSRGGFHTINNSNELGDVDYPNMEDILGASQYSLPNF